MRKNFGSGYDETIALDVNLEPPCAPCGKKLTARDAKFYRKVREALPRYLILAFS